MHPRHPLLPVILLSLAACASPKATGPTAALERARHPADSATLLADSPHFEYDVRFTNPECQQYNYTTPVETNSGAQITSRPKNVFCSHNDSVASGTRPEAPQAKLLEWINDPETKEIFFTYLSFSNTKVKKALCDAATNRDVKITFIIDQTSDTSSANDLAACGGANNKPKLVIRGHSGGIGYAHNKIFIVNPNSSDKIRISFGSGNMTSGIVLHHENWHFITTSVSTYFAQSHLCVMKNTLSSDASSSLEKYSKAMQACRAAITAPEEEDIKAMFIPGDGERATNFMINGYKNFPGIASAKEIWIAAHRFSYNRMRKALWSRMKSAGSQVDMRLVADDDMYWVGVSGQAFGDNDASEYQNAQNLVQLGAKAKWMETNDSEHLLHHNKYLIFDDKAVFAGAGNLTGTGFNSNFENYYYITIPEVVAKFKAQYKHVWNDLATAPENMPKEHTIPVVAP